jgi:acyl phosphate:glycerol-3-phosphate acyltransferase
MWSDFILVFAAYFLGGAPHLTLLARLRRVQLNGDFHQDLWKRAGKTAGFIGVLGEFAKGVIPVLAGRWLGFGPVTVALAGLAVVCGQMWPVFKKFDGEKGNSIAIAMAAVLSPQPAIIAIIIIIVALIIRTVPRLMSKPADGKRVIIGGAYSRSLPIGMALCFLSLPFSSWYFKLPPEIIWSTAGLFILIMARRLTAGLSVDLKASRDKKRVIINRLLYDRAAEYLRL